MRNEKRLKEKGMMEGKIKWEQESHKGKEKSGEKKKVRKMRSKERGKE